MTAIEEIEELLAKHAHVHYKISGNSLTVDAPSPDGFALSLIEGASEWVVHFDGWHEHFDKKEAALDCFAFGLSDECRLRIAFRGNIAYRWTVQSRTESGWASDSTTGLVFFPFWRQKRIRYRQNKILTGHRTKPATRDRDPDS